MLVALQELREQLLSPSKDWEEAKRGAFEQNPWFTMREIQRMVDLISNHYLEHSKLRNWLSAYELPGNPKPIRLAIIAAGNIPLVSFHDILCAVICGCEVQVKPSSKDSVLTEWICLKLRALLPEADLGIHCVDTISNFDAIIATGGELASNQFRKYLELKPGLIRSHRNSVGILTGLETDDDIEALGLDVFSYYGLGCRNVSKIYIPKSIDVRGLLEVFDRRYAYVMDLHRYAHNYDFQLAAMLINRLTFLQGKTVLLRPSGNLHANIATLNYEYYDDLKGLCGHLAAHENQIQVVSVNAEIDFPRTCRLGEAQWPELNDFQDGIDVIRFLSQLQID